MTRNHWCLKWNVPQNQEKVSSPFQFYLWGYFQDNKIFHFIWCRKKNPSNKPAKTATTSLIVNESHWNQRGCAFLSYFVSFAVMWLEFSRTASPPSLNWCIIKMTFWHLDWGTVKLLLCWGWIWKQKSVTWLCMWLRAGPSLTQETLGQLSHHIFFPVCSVVLDDTRTTLWLTYWHETMSRLGLRNSDNLHVKSPTKQRSPKKPSLVCFFFKTGPKFLKPVK